jgi:UDP-N-acetyl-D-galactosamine dehydrogenase
MMPLNKKNLNLAVIGLGYVGLPLVLEFAKKRKVIGFDINETRVKELNVGIDKNREFTRKEIQKTSSITFTKNVKDLISSNCYIITVPTPVDNFNKPDLEALKKASKMVGGILNKGDLVIYESTVYPGCIEEECIPILEKSSKLKINKDLFCGYSPERINPGDRKHTISNIKKITSGSTPDIANLVDDLYNEIITVGTHKAPSIKVAEAAKVIENTQRDLNIALINELSILFNKMKIDTKAVLDAAGSKWNFLPFKPGLVGGHCIGVDPYYLTYKAESIGYHPKIILAGRDTNDSMGTYVALKLIDEMKNQNISIKGSNILIMGLTFKENCSDIRNSGVERVIKELKKFDCNLDLFDPLTNSEEIYETYRMYLKDKLIQNTYDGIIIAVAHEVFKNMGIKKIKDLCKKNHIIYDLKYLFSKEEVDLRL